MIIERLDTIVEVALSKQDTMAFRGERLKTMREARGFTQQELANLLQVIQPTIVKWEHSRSEPNAVYLKRMSEILGITVDYLLGLVDDPVSRVDGIDELSQKYLDLMNNPHIPSQVKDRLKYFIEGILSAHPRLGDGVDRGEK